MGAKVDNFFIETAELLFIAAHLDKQQKLPYLQKASSKLNLLKFFIQISWELKMLDNKKFIALSSSLDEVGRMLGGWQRGLIKETPM